MLVDNMLFEDCVSVIVDVIVDFFECGDLCVEIFDINEGKEFFKFCKKILILFKKLFEKCVKVICEFV